MIRVALALWLLCGLPVLAAPVQVTSGEHEGFTRLVLDFGTPVNWRMGRSADGYELAVDGPSPAYDLRQVFDLIGNSRLAAIWLDPQKGSLHVGLACACHAIPFEFRPGIVVIDLKDGPPPKGSAFELEMTGEPAAPLPEAPLQRPKPRPDTAGPADYNWIDLARTGAAPEQPAAAAPAILPPDPALAPLRESLLHQMAQGAAAGVVDMQKPEAGHALPETAFPLAQIRIGDTPGNVLAPESSQKPDLTAKGENCLAEERLALSEWGDAERPIVDQFAEARSGLTGEFDRPEPEAVARAIRFQLFLGFGNEARQTLQALAPDAADAPIWTAMGHLLDDEEDPTHLFRGMLACEGPSALWALLDAPEPIKGEPVATGAIRLAFSALPLHLRRQLGPRLAQRFLDMGDEDSARALQDAILRAPPDGGRDVSLMTARLDLHQGKIGEAEATAETLLADPGPDTPEALIALVEARARQGLPVEADTAVALEALLDEHEGSALAPRLKSAWVLAEAASGDFETAFAALPETPDITEDVWGLTATLAPDDDFLSAAVLPTDSQLPGLQSETRQAIARRLLALGLAQPADRWVEGMGDVDPVLAAQIALGRGDGRAALIALAGQETEEARGLRLRALELTGQEAPRAELLAKAEDPGATVVAQARAGDWQALSHSPVTLWSDLATRLETTQPAADAGAPPGPLAQGHSLIAAGEATRQAVDSLLVTLPVPETDETR